jgi:2-keto-4-pentenoate hydratase/2-oxohepta-3-ene-1,7-dioic acid hydratase in catechol pathway
MRLVTFREAGFVRAGCLVNGAISDFSAQDSALELDILSIIDKWDDIAGDLRSAVRSAPTLPIDKVELLAPIPRPRRNMFCVGKNYFEHAREFHKSGFDASAGNAEIPEVPIIFSKTPTTVIGPGADIPGSLDPTKSVDYEIELAVVIGKARTRHRPEGRLLARLWIHDRQ